MNDFDELLLPLTIITTIVCGVILLWLSSAFRAWNRSRRTYKSLLLSLAGWVILSTGILAAMASLILPVAMQVLVLLLLVILIAIGWNARANRQMIMLSIAGAARMGVPIPEVLRALGDERADSVGRRARFLATMLDRGHPLDRAIAQIVGYPSMDSHLAVLMSQHFGFLGSTLQRAIERDDMERTRLKFVEGALYLLGMIISASAVIMFLAIKIVPVIWTMLEEFDLPQSAIAQLVIVLLDWLSPFALPIGLAVFALFLFVLLRHLNWIPADLPVVSRFGRPFDNARILEALAMAVDAGQPIHTALLLLSEEYPKMVWRRRLLKIIQTMERGEPWVECLAKMGVIKSAGKAVLRSAERAGNLSWALGELARIIRRRYIVKIELLYRVVGSCIVLLMGGFFLLIALMIFVPLTQLIYALA